MNRMNHQGLGDSYDGLDAFGGSVLTHRAHSGNLPLALLVVPAQHASGAPWSKESSKLLSPRSCTGGVLICKETSEGAQDRQESKGLQDRLGWTWLCILNGTTSTGGT